MAVRPVLRGGIAISSDRPSLHYGDIKAAIEKRLFIGRVPPGTTDEAIASVFGIYGTLTECRVVPGKGPTTNSLAFVAFDTWSAAHRALLETDGRRRIPGYEGSKELVVSFAERHEVGRGGGLAYAKGLDVDRVFVGSLPEDSTEQEISNVFSAVGLIEDVRLLPAKSARRCGYVTFKVWGEAMDAVELLNGQPLRLGREPMCVSLAEPKDPGFRAAAAAPHAAALPPAKRRRLADGSHTSEVDINTLLAAYISAVAGDSPRSACDAIHEQLMLLKEPVVPAWSSSSRQASYGASVHLPAGLAPLRRTSPAWGDASSGLAEDLENTRLFIGGLPAETTDEDLRALISQLTFSVPPADADLLECRVLIGRGCGYIRFRSRQAADEARHLLDERQVTGWQQALRARWATPRAERPGFDGGSSERQTFDCASQDPPDPMSYASLDELTAAGLEPTRLFIGQIAREADVDGVLRQEFERYGTIQEFRWVPTKGVLYVAYGTFEEARLAKQVLEGTPIAGISKGLNVKFSQRR